MRGLTLGRANSRTGAKAAPGDTERTLELSFARAPDGETFISHQRAPYPFHVCRALRYAHDPEGMATVYLQSSSGGIYEGERLGLDLEAAPGSSAHVTTQASTIVHGMTTGHAVHRATLWVPSGAVLEYLPDPLILFPRARLHSSVRIVAGPDARIIVGDCYLQHDPAGSGRAFDALVSHWDVEDEAGNFAARDRYEVGGDALGTLPTGGRPFAAHGSMVMIADAETAERALGHVRHVLAADEANHRDAYAGASTLPGDRGIWARVLAADSAALRRVMRAVWAAMRSAMTGEVPQMRRK